MILDTQDLFNDGSVDSTMLFQKLLNQLDASNDQEKILNVLEGTYLFVREEGTSAIIDWPPGVTIRGIGRVVLLMNPRHVTIDEYEALSQIRFSRLLTITTSGPKRCIENITLNGGYSPANGEHLPTGPVEHNGLIYIGPFSPSSEEPETEVEIKNCRFESVGGDGISIYNAQSNVTISNCSSKFCYRSAIAITGKGTGDAWVKVFNFIAEPQLIDLNVDTSYEGNPVFVTDAFDAEKDTGETRANVEVSDSHFGNVQFDFGKNSTAIFNRVSTADYNENELFSYILGGVDPSVSIELNDCHGGHGVRYISNTQLKVNGGQYEFFHIQPGTRSRLPDHRSKCELDSVQIRGFSFVDPEGGFGGPHAITTNTFYEEAVPNTTLVIRKCKFRYPIYIDAMDLHMIKVRSLLSFLVNGMRRRFIRHPLLNKKPLALVQVRSRRNIKVKESVFIFSRNRNYSGTYQKKWY